MSEQTKNMEIVRNGYDKIAGAYHDQRNIHDNSKELEDFMKLLPKTARVLDVGCGAGVPVCKNLVENGCDTTGIDFSEEMLNLARRNVPEAQFVKMNMTELAFGENSFDGLTAFYCIFHVPKELHSVVFESFHKILKPGGVILVCMGPDEWEACEIYFGVDMWWSHYAPEKSLEIVKEAGFEIIADRHVINSLDEKHYWIFARNK